MRFGVEIAPWGELADPRALASLAALAESAGWDGFFLWDAMLHDPDDLPKADPWIALAAIAMSTEVIRIGPMLTPVPRRRPWKVAREAVTLDHLSGGRLILGVGLGDPSDEEFGWFGEPGVDHATRARMLDEGLAILDGLWSGKVFSFAGEFYSLAPMTFRPTPLQSPRIPIWIGGWWPNRAPMRRAARWDGAHPNRAGGSMIPAEVAEIAAFIWQHRTSEDPFDLVIGDYPSAAPTDELIGRIESLEQAGATWWVEKLGATSLHLAEARIRQGPPRKW
jgi:alkanesulfonate monooxygenase SsuD/methylene tetrahydromethanopterin reductase-like flavin-dependent oxidoreductase (luciferase family)